MNAPIMRIAIVGAGPAGLYSASHLLENRDLVVEIDFIERLPTPWGLVRTGVAPDHSEKKKIVDRLFDFILRDERVRFFGNLKVGTDVQVAELEQWYDAVIFAHGAGSHNAIGIPGEDLHGVWGARDFVQFYNAHPDQAGLAFDLSQPRAVIVGNGNVAIDIARILTTDVEVLAKTDIADSALDALRTSQIREVVIMARRNLEFAAFNNPELEEFAHSEGVDFAAHGAIEPPNLGSDRFEMWRAQRRFEIMSNLLERPRNPKNKRIVFHFLATPVALHGRGRVERLDYLSNRVVQRDGAISYEQAHEVQSLECGLVFSACGYRGAVLEGLPFDSASGVVPNRAGRVLDRNTDRAGTYVVGWIKRGCRGIIGSNRRCASETVDSLLADQKAGLLGGATLDRQDVEVALASRNPAIVRFEHWRAIDRAERMAGKRSGRPRVKLADVDALLEAAFAKQQGEAGAGPIELGAP